MDLNQPQAATGRWVDGVGGRGVAAKEWVNGSLGEDETGSDPKGKSCLSTGRER